jgi:prephenate dehydrogenase
VFVTDIDASKLPKRANGIRAATFDKIGQCDVVILAVPFGALETAITGLRDHLAEDTVVMDVVSTKARATDALQSVLDDHPNVMASHPLFGPPSMRHIEPGGRIVVTYEKGPRTVDLHRFLRADLRLHVLKLTPDEHDEAMAYMQALPFFIARALIKLKVLDIPHWEQLSIPSFEKLASIAAIEKHHSSAMFDTSQRSNPFAKEARDRLLKTLQELHREIGEGAVC